MRPFNLEEAKAGKPVCTIDGRKVRILCSDAKFSYPIVGLVLQEEDLELPEYWDKNGKWEGGTPNLNLMMAPVKHEGWMNIYRFSLQSSKYYGNDIFKTREEAVEADIDGDAVATIHIEWEE